MTVKVHAFQIYDGCTRSWGGEIWPETLDVDHADISLKFSSNFDNQYCLNISTINEIIFLQGKDMKTQNRYWEIRLSDCRNSLEKNNFDAFIAGTPSDAKKIVIDKIIASIDIKSVSWGDSLTLYSTEILEYFRNKSGIKLIETFAGNISREKIMERRRKAMLTDLFFTGTNAVVDSGMLVNLDMIGNRVGGITFGPKYVVIMVGRNKIVKNLDEAMTRIKNIAAPQNAIRHSIKTPCVKTSFCLDCKSPDRICNVWTIHEKSYPKGRIKVILINQDLGL